MYIIIIKCRDSILSNKLKTIMYLDLIQRSYHMQWKKLIKYMVDWT